MEYLEKTSFQDNFLPFLSSIFLEINCTSKYQTVSANFLIILESKVTDRNSLVCSKHDHDYDDDDDDDDDDRNAGSCTQGHNIIAP